MTKLDCAILVAGRSPAPFEMASEQIPLLGRSLLQRSIEALALAGIREVNVLLGEDPLPTRRLLDDGSRWGCRVAYHHTRSGESLGAFARRLQLPPERGCVLADAARMPVAVADGLAASLDLLDTGQIWVTEAHGRTTWSGWGSVTGEWLLTCSAPVGEPGLDERLLGDQRLVHIDVPTVISVATPANIRDAADALLAVRDKPITIGRSCRIHPTAVLTPPVWVGDNVRIGPRTHLGPGVVIGDGALLEQDVTLAHAVILPETFVGKGLEIKNAVAGGSRLASIGLDTTIDIADPHLLSALPTRANVGAPNWGERALATTLSVVLLPVRIGLGRARRRQPLFVAEPAGGQLGMSEIHLAIADPSEARRADGSCDLRQHFRDCFYPGLRDVAAGRLRLLGPTPRPRETVDDLPEVWRLIYASNRPGLLNEGLLQPLDATLPELQMASDSVAAATQDDAAARGRVLRNYLGSMLRQLWKRWTETDAPDYASACERAQRRTA